MRAIGVVLAAVCGLVLPATSSAWQVSNDPVPAVGLAGAGDRVPHPHEGVLPGSYGRPLQSMRGDRSSRPPSRGQEELRKLAIGLDAIFSEYYRLKDVGCAAAPGVTMCKVEDSSLSVRLSAEYTLSERFGFGLALSKNDFSVWKQYGSRSFDTSVRAWALDGYTNWRPVRVGPFDPYVEVGGSWIYNSLDYPIEFQDDFPESQSGLRVYAGGGLGYALTDRYSVRAGYTYISGGGNDADTHNRVYIGFRREF